MTMCRVLTLRNGKGSIEEMGPKLVFDRGHLNRALSGPKWCFCLFVQFFTRLTTNQQAFARLVYSVALAMRFTVCAQSRYGGLAYLRCFARTISDRNVPKGISSKQSARMPHFHPSSDLVASPCVNRCRLDERTGLCEGCLRTCDEIAAWGTASNAQKRAILEAVGTRSVS